MDKNIIKKYLSNLNLSEALDGTPGIKLNKKIGTDNKKVNNTGVSDIGKDMTSYEKGLTKTNTGDKTMSTNKFNYNTDKEKQYHDEFEIMNGQEMIQYDRMPNDTFRERAIEAIEGSTRMGNNPEWANVVAKGQGGDPEFGKNLVKNIKKSQNKRITQTPTSKMFGDDWELTNSTSHKQIAVENYKNKKTMKENNNYYFKDDEEYNDGRLNFNNIISDAKVDEYFSAYNISGNEINVSFEFEKDNEYKGIVIMDVLLSQVDIDSYMDEVTVDFNYEIESGLLIVNFKTGEKESGNLDDNEIKNITDKFSEQIYNEIQEKITDYYIKNNGDVNFKNKQRMNNYSNLAKKVEEPMKGLDADYEKDSRSQQYGTNPYQGMEENTKNNKKQVKEGIKRLKFKKEFNGVKNALKLIPESYKVDNKIFEMTDGNEKYRIRWEGSLNEGNAIVLMASEKNLVNEDIEKMKHLFGYKSQDTLGVVRGSARIDENKQFTDIWNKMKKIIK